MIQAPSVALVCMSTDDGGVESLIYRMALWYRGQGFAVIVLSTQRGRMHTLLRRAGCSIIYDYTVINAASPSSVVDAKIDRYLRKVSGAGIRYAMGFCAASSFMALEISLRAKTQCIAGIYHPDGYCSRSNAATYGCLLKSFSLRGALVTMNAACLQSHEEFYGDRLTAQIVPLPIAAGASLYKPEPRAYRILSIGRMADFKTYNLYMMDVLQALRPKLPSLKYTMVGDGPLKTAVERRVRECGLEDVVSMVGHVDYDRLFGLVKRHDIHVGMGTAALDVAGMGMPSLVASPYTMNPFCRGFIQELPQWTLGEIPSEDGDRPLADRLTEFFASEDRHSYGEAGRAYVVRNYSVDAVMEKLHRVASTARVPEAGDKVAWRPAAVDPGRNLYASLSARLPVVRNLVRAARRRWSR